MIKKIIIEVGGKEISLTIDEARKLKQDLDTVLNNRPIIPNLTFPNHPIYPKYDITCNYSTDASGHCNEKAWNLSNEVPMVLNIQGIK